MYSVKEIYYTLQGEGARTGRAAIFCRFSGCNLWTGREEDRHKAICQFCDTDFIGTDGSLGGKYETAHELAELIKNMWPSNTAKPYVVFTGGEPLLQLDTALIDAIHHHNFEIAIETNGTLPLPDSIDWVCMSPKPNTNILVRKGNELKFIFPQKDFDPLLFESLDFEFYFIQPMDNENIEIHTQQSISFCLENPKWRLSLQTHKIIGLR